MPWIDGEWEVCKDENMERRQRDTPGTPEFNAELETDEAWHRFDKAEAKREDAENIDKNECANCGRVERVGVLIEATRRGYGLGEWYCLPGQGCCDETETSIIGSYTNVRKK